MNNSHVQERMYLDNKITTNNINIKSVVNAILY